MADKDKNKVVDMKNTKSKAISLGKILPEIHKMFMKGLKPVIQSYYDNLDDVLFDRAERATNNEQQNHYFDAMREIRKQKELMVRKFSESIQHIFKQFKKGQFDYFQEIPAKTKKNQKSGFSMEGLSLVEESDLDEKLAINNMVNKINTFFHNHLFALEKRFTLLAGGSEIKTEHVPISPDVIVKSFSKNLADLDMEVTVKLIVLKLFERSLVQSLGAVYEQVNQFLVEKDIYPNIRFSIQNRGNAPQMMRRPPLQQPMELEPTTDPNSTAQAYTGDGQQANIPVVPDAYYEQIMQGFNHNSSGTSITNLPIFDPSIVQNALSLLQLEELSSLTEHSKGLSPTEIKEQLLKKLKDLDSSDEDKAVKKQDEDTIDLISMLFQFLVDDRNLPDKIQVLLGKLQIPYLHIALKDRSLFADKENNARKLLDSLAQASIGWSEETDTHKRFIKKLESIVHEVLQNHQKEINFEELIEDFEKFNQKLQKRTKVFERRTHQRALGSERILVAKQETAKVLKAKMKNYRLPKMVTDILLNSWANVLVLTHLRHKNEPEIWVKNTKFVDMLIYVSSKNKKKNASKEQIEHVCKRLEYGLKMVAFDQAGIKKIQQELIELLFQINELESQSTADIELISAQEVLEIDEQSEQKAPEIISFINNKTVNDEKKQPIPHVDDEYLQAAKELKNGEWVEFIATEEGEENIRAKLSWVSPISQRLLFVNARGLKITDKTTDELAHEFRINLARVLQQVPIFDRAMSSIAEKMKKHPKQEPNEK